MEKELIEIHKIFEHRTLTLKEKNKLKTLDVIFFHPLFFLITTVKLK